MGETFGDRLAAARKKRELMQEDLAQAIGVRALAISRYERGEIQAPRMDKIRKLAEVLQVSADWLVSGDQPTESRIETDRGRYPALNAFLEGAEGRTATPEEIAELENEQYHDGSPSELSYHYKLLAIRARAKGKAVERVPSEPAPRPDVPALARTKRK